MPLLQVAADRRPLSFRWWHPDALFRKAPRVKPRVVRPTQPGPPPLSIKGARMTHQVPPTGSEPPHAPLLRTITRTLLRVRPAVEHRDHRNLPLPGASSKLRICCSPNKPTPLSPSQPSVATRTATSTSARATSESVSWAILLPKSGAIQCWLLHFADQSRHSRPTRSF